MTYYEVMVECDVSVIDLGKFRTLFKGELTFVDRCMQLNLLIVIDNYFNRPHQEGKSR